MADNPAACACLSLTQKRQASWRCPLLTGRSIYCSVRTLAGMLPGSSFVASLRAAQVCCVASPNGIASVLLRWLSFRQQTTSGELAMRVSDDRLEMALRLLKGSARQALFDATRLKDQQFVALVAGGKDERSRERVFAGFNSPLLPEVLVCTSVGQEGIDLHRHCRHVVHYDLAWNPAVLEQRTGRVDRIGSKTFRERSHGEADGTGPFLAIGVPFLAGTYDERMYGELRLRAQTFEVLTGGDVAADGENREGRDDMGGAEGSCQRVAMVPLPERMLRELRVNLHVWSESSREEESVPQQNLR